MKTNNAEKDFIRKTVLSYKPDFNLETLEIGLEKFEVRYSKAGDYLLQAGEVCKNIFMVENSISRCFFVDRDGEEKTVWLEGESTVITDYESFSEQSVGRCFICCYEDSPVYSIDKVNLMTLYAQYHEWAIFGLLVMEKHYVNLLKFRNTISFNTAAENYDLIESYYGRYLEVVPLKHLASWMNISPVHLSRIRKERLKLL